MGQRPRRSNKKNKTVRRQCGSGVDIQKWSNRTGIEFHWPGYQFMGPGTHLKKRLARDDKAINRLVRTARSHDIEYRRAKSLREKHVAYKRKIEAINALGP